MTNIRDRVKKWAAFTLAVGMMLTAFAGSAAAQGADNEPHFFLLETPNVEGEGCFLQLIGESMPEDNGHFTLFKDIPDGEDEVVAEEVEFHTDEEDPRGGFSFESMKFSITETATFYAKARIGTEDPLHFTTSPIIADCGEKKISPAECQDTLTAEALENETILLQWDEDFADYYEIHRKTPGADEFDFIDSTTATTFTDENVEAGQTFVYKVIAVNDQAAAPPATDSCGTAEVTAIPFFGGTPLVGALAALAGVGAYVTIRRR